MSQAYPPEKSGQPGSGMLPSRSATGFSSKDGGAISDDDAVPEFDTSDTIGALTERLQAWKHACGYLENYLQAAEKMEKAQAKEYEKMLKAINNPLKEGHHFDQELGGIAGLFENLRSNTQGVSNSHTETAKNISGTVLPILTRLHQEIKNKNKEIENGVGKGAKAVATARNSSQRYIELLGQHAALFDSTSGKIGGKTDGQHDPYVLHRGAQFRLHKQVMEENNSRNDFIAVQKNFEIFEAHVIQVIQQAFGAFMQVMHGELDRQKAMYGDIVATAQQIPQDFEWTRFVRRSGQVLVDPAAPPREVKGISYPNEDHAATKPLIQGTLERKSRATGVLTGYKSGFYAVTPAKFLHQFDSDDNFRKDPSPELSLYLPECTIGAVADTKFNVKGKDASKGKVGAAFQMSHEMAFKAPTASDAREWHRIISQCVGSATADTPTSTVASPISPGSGSPAASPPVYDIKNPAPILTDVKTVQSPTSASASASAAPASGTPASASAPVATATPATATTPATAQSATSPLAAPEKQASK